jgi:cytochrome b pre-mRNA-processing protein 3
MLFGLFRRKPPRQVVATYTSIVAQARQPHFYAELDVPDTIDGRFEMVSLHTILVLDRLRGEKGAASAFGQELFDLFFSDMDSSLREMGVGDTSVPKKIKKMAEAFYGRAAALGEALAADGRQPLVDMIRRNLHAGREAADAAAITALAAYVRAAAEALAAQPLDDILDGRPAWPQAGLFTREGANR